MSKLFENKQQLIHVASEVVVLLGITFYFSQQNKKLMGHIEDLAQQVEEQNDIIISHEKILKTHEASIKTLENMLKFNSFQQPQPQQMYFEPPKPTKKKSVSFKDKHEEIPITYSSKPKQNNNYSPPQSPPPSPSPDHSRPNIPTVISAIPAFFNMTNESNFFNSKPQSNSTVEEIEEEPINEEELDAELAEELKDLNENTESEEDDLKKTE